MSEKSNRVLYVFTAILFISYLLSFVKSCKANNKREVIKTALVNPKYENSIKKFELYDDKGQIFITKTENEGNAYWEISEEENGFKCPANQKRMTQFIEELTKIRNMYKLSDSIQENTSYGLLDNQAFHIRYFYDKENFHELVFGNQDFSLTSRYIMTNLNTRVYETDTDLDSYLSSNAQSWTEGLIISQNVLGKIKEEDIQTVTVRGKDKSGIISDKNKLLELRYGGIAQSNFDENSQDLTINLQLGNKTQIQLYFYPTENESEIAMKSVYENSNSTKKIYYSKISLWTYSKIKEITL